MAKETAKKTKKSVTKTKKGTKVEKKQPKVIKQKTKGKEIMAQFDTKASVESKKMMIIIAAILVVLGIFYLIVGIANGSIDLNKNEPAKIQNSEILAGSTFKQDDEEYLVLYYDFTKEDAEKYKNLIGTYTSSDNSISIYAVDLSRKFNSSYIKTDRDTTNTNPTNAQELKVSNPTLIKIKDKNVVEYIEDYNEIENYMSPSSN